ncbi:MAG: histidine phosphatase family protein, partial [Leucothrix sp.]
MRHVYFITHPEVIVDAAVSVPDWSLSERGLERMQLATKQSWVSELTSLYCSTEKKAIDGANVLAEYCALPIQAIEDLGENDRSSTGYLPANEFETVADQFFAAPQTSIRGWETAETAQVRIVNAVTKLIDEDQSDGAIAIVSHGAVGTLFMCHLANYSIDRRYDQPGGGGGNYFAFELA